MAAVPFSQQWFSHWSPPSHIYNTYMQQSYHVPHFQQQEISFETFPQQGSFPKHEPYRTQQPASFGSVLTPGVHILKGPRAFSSVYQSAPSGNEQVENFQVTLNQEVIHPRQSYSKSKITEGRKSQIINNNNGHSYSMLRLLPALLTAGLIRGNDIHQIRGDQAPDMPDPDRDLGGAPPLRTLYHWKLVDFEYESDHERRLAINSKEFVPLNTLPLGIEIWKDRLFVTFPRWKEGVPCTLATLPRAPTPKDVFAKLKPYPSWSWHRQQGDCTGLTSVFRLNADRCGRLWVLDSGQVESLATARQVCPPQILAFDLNTDRLIGRWPIPDEHVRQNSLFTNIVSDIRGDDCDGVHIYFTDVWRFSLLVFRLQDERFWRFNSHLFYPDPMASDYTLHGLNFQWSDGIFGLSLTALDNRNDRTLYFHPMSSFREFKVPVSLLRNESAINDTALIAKSIQLAGDSRGYNGQSSASAIAKNQVMFYNLVLRDAVGCWDTRKPYLKSTQGVVTQDMERLIFPNDLKIDNEERQSVWVLSNKLPTFIYTTLDPNVINFRIMREYVDESIEGTVCDPKVINIGSHQAETECY